MLEDAYRVIAEQLTLGFDGYEHDRRIDLLLPPATLARKKVTFLGTFPLLNRTSVW